MATEMFREISQVGPEFVAWFLEGAPHLIDQGPLVQSILAHNLHGAHVKGMRILIMLDENAAHAIRNVANKPMTNLQNFLEACVHTPFLEDCVHTPLNLGAEPRRG